MVIIITLQSNDHNNNEILRCIYALYNLRTGPPVEGTQFSTPSQCGTETHEHYLEK
jgi:hypothetical protein